MNVTERQAWLEQAHQISPPLPPPVIVTASVGLAILGGLWCAATAVFDLGVRAVAWAKFMGDRY